MQRKNYFAIFIAIIAFVFTLPPFAAAVTDDISGHPLEMQMRALNDQGIMKGYGNGQFKPEQEVTRAEFSAFLGRSLTLPNGSANQFKDTIGHNLAFEVERAAAAGLIKGIGNGLFAPNRTITREEMAVMVDRALLARNIVGKVTHIGVIDEPSIKYKENVSRLFDLGVMSEYPDITFRPKEKVTRSQTALTIYRMMKIMESKKLEDVLDDAEKGKPIPTQPPTTTPITPADPNAPKMAVAKGFTILYAEDMTRSITYMTTDTEMKYLGEDSTKVKVQLVDTVGYVKPSDVEIKAQTSDRSHYKVTNGNLIHVVKRTTKFESYLFGPAPSFLKEGEIDYSWNGNTFTKGTAYQYFNILPLHTTTSYTGEELDQFIQSQQPDSPLIGLGSVFKKVEAETGVNGLYLMAHAIHESGWGKSQIAKEKKNLYGLKATDSDPLGNATAYNSFEDSIRHAATYVKARYLTPGERTYYRGAFLGNKSVGMNVYYASDPYWGQKIAGLMYRADTHLGKKDWKKHKLAVNKVDSLNVRGVPEVGQQLQYEYHLAGMSMIILDEVKTADGLWYKIKSDHPDYAEAYVYGNGKLGNYVKVLP